MHKKHLLTFLLIINTIIVYTQEPIYFNNIYNPVNTYASGRGIMQVGNHYYGIFGTLESSGYWYNIGVFKMSLSGNFIDWNLIGEDGHDYFAGSVGGTLIETIDGNLAFACHIGAPGPTIGTLVKLNLELDTIWQKIYQIEEQYTFTIKAKQTSDSGYVIVGQVYPGTGYYFDALIIKTNDMGNIQWYNTFGVNSNASEYGTDVIETPDGGYLIGGMKNIGSIDHSLDALLIKTDSLGNEEWTQTYGNPDVDDDMALVALADDGNYLVATVYGVNATSNSDRRGRTWFLKIDSDGNIIDEVKIGDVNRSQYIKNFRKTEDGYIASGFFVDSTFITYKGFLLKIDENLDSIWMRKYSHFNELYDYNYFYDASPTTDNGYIAIGQARPDQGGSTNKMWVVKVDSMGCDTPGCATGTQVFELPLEWNTKIKVYPNPANNYLIVELMTGNLHGTDLTLYDNQGRPIKTIKVPGIQQHYVMSIDGLETGIYFLRVEQNGKTLETKKFSKIH